MARPIEFECVVESKDPEVDYHELLSAPASEEALSTLREAQQLDMTRVRITRRKETQDLR